MQNYLLTYRNN